MNASTLLASNSAKSRRNVVRQKALEFLNSALHVPARIPSERAAALLGTPPLVLTALTREGIVACLGAPRHNGSTYYHGPYILWLRGNRDFLSQSEAFARQHWRERNETATTAAQQRTWKNYLPPAEFPVLPVPLDLDPVVGIEVAQVILGLAAHELRLLAKQKMLPLAGGSGERCQHKRFFVADLLDCHRSPGWMDRAQRAITDFWRRKNAPKPLPATSAGS